MTAPQNRYRARHRAPLTPLRHTKRATEPEDQPDPELVSYLAALAPNDDHKAAEITGRFATTQTLSLRMSALDLEHLRRLADARGLAPAELAAEWVRERLATEDTNTGPLPQSDAEPYGHLGRHRSL